MSQMYFINQKNLINILMSDDEREVLQNRWKKILQCPVPELDVVIGTICPSLCVISGAFCNSVWTGFLGSIASFLLLNTQGPFPRSYILICKIQMFPYLSVSSNIGMTYSSLVAWKSTGQLHSTVDLTIFVGAVLFFSQKILNVVLLTSELTLMLNLNLRALVHAFRILKYTSYAYIDPNA